MPHSRRPPPLLPARGSMHFRYKFSGVSTNPYRTSHRSPFLSHKTLRFSYFSFPPPKPKQDKSLYTPSVFLSLFHIGDIVTRRRLASTQGEGRRGNWGRQQIARSKISLFSPSLSPFFSLFSRHRKPRHTSSRATVTDDIVKREGVEGESVKGRVLFWRGVG